VSPILGSRVHADVAIVLEWNAWWGSSLDSHPTVDLKQMEQIRSWHRALWEAGITCDFVHPDRDLDGYRLLLVPSLYACGDEFGARLAAAVTGGAHVVVGPFSGIVDLDDHIRLGGYPGAFTDLLGIRSEEFSPLQDGQVVPLEGEISDSGSPSATIWTELIRVQGAQVLARFGGGVFPGEPAITVQENAEGGGRAWYIGTVPDPTTLATILRQACGHAEVGPALADSTGLDITVRTAADATFICAVNHGDRHIALPVDGLDLLTGRTWSAGDALAGGGVAVVRRAD